MRRGRRTLAMLLTAGLSVGFAAAPVRAQDAGKAPPPPYIAHGAHHLTVGFEVDGAALRSLLPPGLEPASNVVALNMYAVPHGLGVAPYTRSYVWADLKGFDAWDGTRGRYVLIGWAEPEGFRRIAHGTLHWPAEPGTTTVERDGDAVRAALTVGGRPIIVARARLTGEVAEGAAALLPYPFVEEGARGAGRAVRREDVGVNLIPWAGTVLMAAPVSVDFRVPEGHPLARLKPKRLAWAVEIRDGNFALGVIRGGG